ncbi:MAG: ATP-binding protein [Deltaproteobacteria bacterium]|nr:ATP-binding protein [Deltaproteobacteria bacterium]
MIDRLITQRIHEIKKSILLLGPRQVGKSTLLKGFSSDLFFNLMDEETFMSFSKDPGRLKRQIGAIQNPKRIIIDEIQRIPTLLNSIQAIVDANPHLQFILTGSSARKLKKGGANLLPGRIVLEHLDPLSYWELKNNFDLERILQLGSLPGIYLDPKSGPEVLGTYATVYLREEIQAEAATKNLGGYARFLDVAAQASGEWINYSKIASDAEIPKETVRRFFTLLEETLLAYRVPPFHPTASKRRVSQRDRFIFFDTGVRNAILGTHKNPASPTEKGKLFEQWIILQIIAFVHGFKKEWRWSAYRTEGGAEVDVIVDVGKKYLAVECKWGKAVTESETRGLLSFESIAKKPVDKYVVYRGENTEKFENGVLAIPFEKFLGDILPSV